MQNLLTLKALYIKGFMVLEMAFRARKVFGKFEKRAAGSTQSTHVTYTPRKQAIGARPLAPLLSATATATGSQIYFRETPRILSRVFAFRKVLFLARKAEDVIQFSSSDDVENPRC